MSERIRLTIAAALTCLLLAAVSVAGAMLHPESSAPVARASAPVKAQVVQSAPSPNWEGEHD